MIRPPYYSSSLLELYGELVGLGVTAARHRITT
jgi:hypothetical protein